MNTFAANTVSRLLARYVEGITKETLEVNVFSGNFVLTDAKIKRAALEGLDLPFDVQRGVVGKLTLRVPWAHIKTRQAELLVENVTLLAVPRDPRSRTWSADEENRRKQERKQERLSTFEDMRTSKEGHSAGAGWSAKLIELVISNLNVVVKNVHIRFEDTSSASPFAIGMTWSQMTLVPTSETWDKTFLTELGVHTFKVASLQNFTIYIVGEKDVKSTEELSQEEWFVFMRSPALSLSEAGRTVGPMDVQLKICQLTYLGLEDDALAAAPLVECMAHIDDLKVLMAKPQYNALLLLLQQLANFSLVWQYAVLRPTESVMEKPRDWWKFAKVCVVKSLRRLRVDQDLVSDGKRRIKTDYVFLWKLFVKAKRKKSAMNATWGRLLTTYEEVLPDLDLISYRVIAYRELDDEAQEARKLRATEPRPGWLSRMTGKKRVESQQNFFLPTFVRKTEKVDSKKVLQRRKTYSLEVAAGTVLLEQDGALSTLKCNGLNFSLADTKIDSTVVMKLRHLSVHDTATPNPLWEQVLGPEGVGNSTLSLLSACYSYAKPASRLEEGNQSLDADSAINVQTLRPLRLVVNDAYLRLLSDFFRPPPGWALLQAGMGIKPVSVCSPSRGRSMLTAVAVNEALEDLVTCHINVVASAPTIVIPHDCAALQTQCLLLNLGQVRLTSRFHLEEKATVRQRARSGRLEEGDTHQWWDVVIKGMRVGVRPCREGVLLPASHGTDVLSETGVKIAYGCSLIPRQTEIPQVLFEGAVGPEVRLKLNHDSLSVVSDLMTQMSALVYEKTVGDVPPPAPTRTHTPDAGAIATEHLASRIVLDTESFVLELGLAPVGHGEQQPVCVMEISDLISTCRIPLEGHSSAKGVAQMCEVTASDGNQQAVLLSTGNPLFSYTTNIDGAIVFDMHLGEATLEPLPAALRRMMTFFAPYTVGVPVISEQLGKYPEATLSDGDLLLTTDTTLGSYALNAANRLLVNSAGDVVISGETTDSLRSDLVLLDLEGAPADYCIVLGSHCKTTFKNFSFHCKKRFQDYILPGSGDYTLQNCVIHSDADKEETDKHAEEWKAYQCAIYLDRTNGFLPRDFEMMWDSCKWVYAWDGSAVVSSFECTALQITAPGEEGSESYDMIKQPTSLSYRARIKQMDEGFEGESTFDMTATDLSCSFTDLLELNNSIFDINNSIYPPEAPLAVHWRDTLLMRFEAPLKICLTSATRGEAYQIKILPPSNEDTMLMTFRTATSPGEAPRWDSDCLLLVSIDVPGKDEWNQLMHPCRLLFKCGEQPTGLPKGCGNWKSTRYSFDILDDVSITVDDEIVTAFSEHAAGAPMKKPAVDGINIGINATLEDGVVKLLDDTSGWTLSAPHHTPPGAIAAVERTAPTPLSRLQYLNCSSDNETLCRVFTMLPYVTHNCLPVWAVSVGRSETYVLLFQAKWCILCLADNEISEVMTAVEGNTAGSPLEAEWDGLEVEEVVLSADAVSFRLYCMQEAAGLRRAIVSYMNKGASLEEASFLCCSSSNLSTAEWMGYTPPGVLHHRFHKLYLKYAPQNADRSESYVDKIVDSGASIDTLIAECCKSFDIPSDSWTGDFPSALSPSEDILETDETEEVCSQIPGCVDFDDVTALLQHLLNFTENSPRQAHQERVALYNFSEGEVLCGPLLQNSSASNIQLLFGGTENVQLDARMMTPRHATVQVAARLCNVWVRIDANEDASFAARRTSEAYIARKQSLVAQTYGSWKHLDLQNEVLEYEGRFFSIITEGKPPGVLYRFAAPLEICNTLPFDVFVGISGNGVKVVSSVSVRRGEMLPIHTLAPTARLFFEVHAACPLTGEDRRSPLSEIHTAQRLSLFDTATQEDALPINLSLFSTAGSRRVTLSAGVWLLNATNRKVHIHFNGRDQILPEGVAMPYEEDGPPCIEGKEVVESCVLELKEGKARVEVLQHETHRLVTVSPMCVFHNHMSRSCKVTFVEEAVLVPTRGTASMQEEYVDQAVKVVIQSHSAVWDVEVAFELPGLGETKVVRLGKLWVPVCISHNSAGALVVDFGGKPPPAQIVLKNQSWCTVVLGEGPSMVSVAPFSMEQAYLSSVEQETLAVGLQGGEGAVFHIENEVVVRIEQRSAAVNFEIRQKGGKGISTFIEVSDPGMLERSLKGVYAPPALSYSATLPNLTLKAGVSSVGGIAFGSFKDMKYTIDFTADGGVSRSTFDVHEASLDSEVARQYQRETLASFVPFAPALLDALLPLCWKRDDGTPVASLNVHDLPCSNVDWSSPDGLRVLLQAAQLDCPDELSDALEALLQSQQGGGSWEGVSQKVMKELALLQEGDNTALLRTAKKLVTKGVKARYGVTVDLEALTVVDVDEVSLADFLLKSSLGSMGPKGVILHSVAQHAKVLEVVQTASKDPEAAAVMREALVAASHSTSTADVLKHLTIAGQTLQHEELLNTISALESIDTASLDPDTLLGEAQRYLGVQQTPPNSINWDTNVNTITTLSKKVASSAEEGSSRFANPMEGVDLNLPNAEVQINKFAQRMLKLLPDQGTIQGKSE